MLELLVAGQMAAKVYKVYRNIPAPMLFAERHAFVEPSLAHYMYQPSNVPIVPVRRASKGYSASS